MYRNKEGYADPTAGIAVGQVMREYKANQKMIWRKQYEMKNQSKVYVVSKYAGDIDKNVADVIKACRFLVDKKKQPIASHLMYPAILGIGDTDTESRTLGLMYGLSLLAMCDEVYVFVTESGLSEGMKQEVREAKKLGKPIKYVKMEEI
ncbi:MAG: DUF4406 domain-containing protein [Phocaeicola sp.]